MIWILLALFLLLSILLSGLESALLSVSRVRLRHQVKTKDRFASRLARLFRHRDRLLSAILVLNNTLNILIFAITTRQLVDSFGNRGYAVAVAFSLPVYLFLLELFPKLYFQRFPYRALCRFLVLLEAIDYLLGPFMVAGPILQRLLGRPKPGATDRDEFRSLTDFVQSEGKIGCHEKQLIHGVLDFNRVTARDIMVPLSRVTAIPLEMPVANAVNLARETLLRQFPVMSPKGELIGVFDAFEVLFEKPGEGAVVHHLHRLVRAQAGEKAITIMRRLRRSGTQLAAVYSGAGRPLGIVSTGDLVRRMLGGS